MIYNHSIPINLRRPFSLSELMMSETDEQYMLAALKLAKKGYGRTSPNPMVGAVLVKGNRIVSAGVILPLSRQGVGRYGTRHLAALGITERFDRCICVVVSEETGTLSLANQGRLERPITSSRLQDLLKELIGVSMGAPSAKGASSSAKSSATAAQPPSRLSVSSSIEDPLP